MRSAFLARLVELARADPRVVLLTGDLGFMVLEPFETEFPDRFINVGVAEANMLGVAAGMASQGLIPFCYSIATFASMRGYEQLRNGAVLHHLPVRVVGVGGGFAYGTAGHTHWAVEDVAILRAQPRLTVIAPGTDAQAERALESTYSLSGPVYYRLGKDSASIQGVELGFRLGRGEILREGSRLVLITTGAMTGETVRAAGLLADSGISATVLQVPCLAPAPSRDIAQAVARHVLAITVEDHYIVGGLGSLVAETIAESGAPCRLIRVGISAKDDGRSGSERWLRIREGLTAESISDLAMRQVELDTIRA